MNPEVELGSNVVVIKTILIPYSCRFVCTVPPVMEQEIANLRRQLQEEQRRREEAEAFTRSSRLKTLREYIQACHKFSLDIQVVTDQTLTIQGDTTKPSGRLFPRRIIPWDGFVSQQEEIWEKLSINSAFHSMHVFPSSHQLDYVRSLIAPISGETGLRNFERDTVENAVQKLVDAAYADERLRRHLQLRGTLTFESHTNLGESKDVSVPTSMEQMPISEDSSTIATRKRNRNGKETALTSSPTTAGSRTSKKPRRARGKGQADQFCIYRTSEGQNIPAVAIEYKAPHKLSQQEIVTGLESEIQPKRDVINQEGDDFSFASKSLAAAVITQLFSYMIGKGIQYGYVCTGEVFVFLYIPDDPTMVYYSVSVPNLDFQEGDENRFHRTAVAQVFAFILRALSMEPPSQSWHDKTTTLETWEMEYIDILKKIPETVRKDPPPSAYKPQRWRGFQRSPIWTRSRCRPPGGETRIDSDEDEDECCMPPSPTPNQTTNSLGSRSLSVSGVTESGKRREADGKGSHQQREQGSRMRIEDRPYCTQQCLLGLTYGGPMHDECPNFHDHGKSHISREDFLRLIRVQLARDRGNNADCKPLHLSGSRGALFKIRLSSRGYTLVAKGMEECDRGLLQRESRVYGRLRELQGYHVPVCLGTVDVDMPYYYNCGVYVCMLFLGWAGRPLFDCINSNNKAHLCEKVSVAFQALHRLHLLHQDAEPRNILYNEENENLMIVDFERARFPDR